GHKLDVVLADEPSTSALRVRTFNQRLGTSAIVICAAPHPSEATGVIQKLGHERQPSTSLAGGSAREHFRFRALAEGEINLSLQYRRPWEDKTREERTFAVRVASKRE